MARDLQAIVDPSVAKSSGITVTAAVDEEEEGSEAEDESGADDFFDKTEASDNGGWESGSVHSQNLGPPAGQVTTSTDSDSEPEPPSGSTLDVDPPGHSGSKTKPQVKLKPKVTFEGENEDDTPVSNSDSDVSNHLLPVQTKAQKVSGGAGTSTFLPSLSVGYIPGTGDSDPEDELEAVEGKDGRKNRRGQRARRALVLFPFTFRRTTHSIPF